LQEWTENALPRTGMTSKMYPTVEFKCGHRRGRLNKVMKCHGKSILGNMATTLGLEKEGSGKQHLCSYKMISPFPHYK
jgi:hypothetical protein